MSADALLFSSFGGPEGPEDVRPFLGGRTPSRGVRAGRLDEVAEQYHHFGGLAPINGLNRSSIEAIEEELAEDGGRARRRAHPQPPGECSPAASNGRLHHQREPRGANCCRVAP